MKTYYLLRNRLKLLFLPAIILSLGACSSYQYSGYETDGIYGESRPGIWEQAENEQTQVKPNNQNNYYKNMFAQQSEMVGELLENDVFTDVDSYSSNDGYDNYSEVGGDVAYVGGNAPWGNDPDTYTVNIINNGSGFGFGFGRPLGWGYGFGHPYFGAFYDPFYDPFFDPFFNPYARRGLAFGFGNRWGYGGFGGPWGYGGFGYGWSYGYNFGFGNPWFNNGFYNRYGYGYPYIGRNRNNVAYNRGRRNTNDYRSTTDRRSGYAQSIRSIRNAQADAARSRSRARGTSDGYDRSNVYSRTSRRTERSAYYNTSNTRTSSPVYRSTRSSSSRSTQTTSPSRRSSSNSRSVRSSSSSSRSSGSSSRSSSSGSSRTSRGGRGGR